MTKTTLRLLLCLTLPSLTASIVMTLPRWLRRANDKKDNLVHWVRSFKRSRRLERNPGLRGAYENVSTPADHAFEPVGVIDLDFNPSYVVYDMFDTGPGLTVSSFHNVAMNPALVAGANTTAAGPPVTPPFIPFERDLVAVITELDSEEPVVECITENTTMDTVWPNEARRAPDGVFPFEAVVVPQGWFTKATPGCLVAFGVETGEDILIHASSHDEPWFYHNIKFVDMDQDGVLDIVTVRSGYQVGRFFKPPLGELVWFRNPGLEAMLDGQEWEEFVLVENLGPDIFLDAKDMTGDGIPEIVATHFFAGSEAMDGSPWDSTSRVTLYGAPKGENWASVNIRRRTTLQPRVADIVVDQGMMFSVEIVDLNGDDRLDILTTNHQSAGDPIDGRVLGVESPESGRLFDDPWTIHILMEGIRPSAAPPGQPSFRMAPGVAMCFKPPLLALSPVVPSPLPWIAVSGDEASKAWVLKPTPEPWVYEEELLLDINDFYGENATSTMLRDPFGITISTIGEIGIREEEGRVTLYVPVFEATDIHVFRSKELAWHPGQEPIDEQEGLDLDESDVIPTSVESARSVANASGCLWEAFLATTIFMSLQTLVE